MGAFQECLKGAQQTCKKIHMHIPKLFTTQRILAHLVIPDFDFFCVCVRHHCFVFVCFFSCLITVITHKTETQYAFCKDNSNKSRVVWTCELNASTTPFRPPQGKKPLLKNHSCLLTHGESVVSGLLIVLLPASPPMWPQSACTTPFAQHPHLHLLTDQ